MAAPDDGDEVQLESLRIVLAVVDALVERGVPRRGAFRIVAKALINGEKDVEGETPPPPHPATPPPTKPRMLDFERYKKKRFIT